MKNINKILSILLVFATASAFISQAFAATPKATDNAKGKLAYTLKGLKYNRAVQNFYIGSTYIYVTQRKDATTYLSRLKIDGDTATYADHMTVENAGHGQSLDMITYKGTDYLYLGCKPESSSNHFSLQIARIKYQAGKTYDYTDLNRLTYMNYATKSTSSLGTTYRVAAGGNNNYTVFRIQTTQGNVTYSIYNTAKLNALLDSSKTVAMNTASARAACVKSFTQKGSNIVRPNSSFQGVDMLSKSKIFISGGGEGQTPQMARMSNSGGFEKLVKITNVGKHEIEGLQCKNNNIYFLIIPDTESKKDTQKIYYLKDSVFN